MVQGLSIVLQVCLLILPCLEGLTALVIPVYWLDLEAVVMQTHLLHVTCLVRG